MHKIKMQCAHVIQGCFWHLSYTPSISVTWFNQRSIFCIIQDLSLLRLGNSNILQFSFFQLCKFIFALVKTVYSFPQHFINSL